MNRNDILSSNNNSNTSSEASDTQSVEDNTPPATNANGLSGIFNSGRYSRKRMKENSNESSRPPWRAVSVSTLPKPDKSSLLRARLLDASRRLRSGKVSIGIQTDIVPTKIMKEASNGAQYDLVLHREVGILTDGSYAKRKEGNDEFILTYSVSLLTDAITRANVSTQTLMPKLPGDNFRKAYYEGETTATDSQEFSELEKKLLQQIQKIRDTTKYHSNNQPYNMQISEIAPPNGAIDNSSFRPSLLTPTLSSWHFEYDELEAGEDRKFFQPYEIQPFRPWNSFTPLLFGMRHAGTIGNRAFDWHLLLHAIDELVQESNRLVDMIEDLTIKKQSAQNGFSNLERIKETPNFIPKGICLPSERWLPIIEQQERELQQMIKKVNEPPPRRQITNNSEIAKKIEAAATQQQ